MQKSDIPAAARWFLQFFGAQADGSTVRNIPEDSQIGITGGAASLETGFPPLTMTPIVAGGIPPFGQDMNGILRMLSQWTQWYTAGGYVPYSAAFQTAIGGYPENAIVASAVTDGVFFISTEDSNLTDPDASGAGWVPFFPQPKVRVITTSGAFSIVMTDQSIGFNRTSAVAVSSAGLPETAFVGFEVAIWDLAGNFQQHPITISRNGAQTIAGATHIVLNVNRQCARFKYFGSNTWGVNL